MVFTYIRQRRFIAVIFFIIFMCFSVIAGIINVGNNISILYTDYNNIMLFILLAIIGSISFIFIFIVFPTNKTIDTISYNTLFIMSTHYFFLQIWSRLSTNYYLGAFLCCVIYCFIVLFYKYIVTKYKCNKLILIGEKLGLFAK